MDMPVVSDETRELLAALRAHRAELDLLFERYGARDARLFGSVARVTAHEGSDIDILVEMDPAEGNLLMRASGLMEEARALLGRDDVDIFPAQLLKTTVSQSAQDEAIGLS